MRLKIYNFVPIPPYLLKTIEIPNEKYKKDKEIQKFLYWNATKGILHEESIDIEDENYDLVIDFIGKERELKDSKNYRDLESILFEIGLHNGDLTYYENPFQNIFVFDEISNYYTDLPEYKKQVLIKKELLDEFKEIVKLIKLINVTESEGIFIFDHLKLNESESLETINELKEFVSNNHLHFLWKEHGVWDNFILRLCVFVIENLGKDLLLNNVLKRREKVWKNT